MSIENPRRSPRVSAVVFLIQGLAVLSVLAGLAVTVMRGDIVQGGPEFGLVRKAWAPPNWVYVAGGLGLLAMMAAPIHPTVGLWVYIALACGFPRYRPEHELLLRSGLLEWVSALSVSGWIGWMIRHGRRPSLPHS